MYSNIRSMRVKNFRNIGDMTLSFEKSPIITLTGDNEAGKTSVIKAFCVAGLNAFTTRQKKYIKDGTNGFGIGIELEDGTAISRIKTPTSNTISIRKSDGTDWSATKIDKGETPVELQSVMGLVVEPETKEMLQIRTYEDQLLFAVTPGSTNYKMMYEALKVDKLRKAIKSGSEEVTSLRRFIDGEIAVKQALLENYRSIKIYDLEPVSNIKDRLRNQLTKVQKLERAIRLLKDIATLQRKLGSTSLIESENIKPIDMGLALALDSSYSTIKLLADLSKKSQVFEKLSTISEISNTLVQNLDSAIRQKSMISEIGVRLGSYSDIEHANIIDISQAMAFESAIAQLSRAKSIDEQIKRIDTTGASEIKDESIGKIQAIEKALKLIAETQSLEQSLTDTTSRIELLTNELKNSGAVVTNCPKCGETVIVDVGTIN